MVNSISIPGYKVERTLGKGGMATVYLAIQESFEREVALKVMNPSLSEDVKFTERFLSEAKIVSRLVHPNIVTVYDVGVEKSHHFLSMEYIPGKDLKSKRRFMTAKQCLQVIREVASALDYASKKGYVHRDVKPENIMLHEDDGRAILMDFGIACMEHTASGMTQTGTAIGTPHYMSPEQAKGRQVDSRSDIYSLGVVLFLCLTGHVPFDADSAVAVGIKHVSEAIPRLPKYLMLLQPIIDKVLAKDSDERYQTGQELIAAIDQITDEDLAAIDILATKKTIARIDTKETEAPTVLSGSVKTIPKVTAQTAVQSKAKQAQKGTSKSVPGQPSRQGRNTNANQSRKRRENSTTGSTARHNTGTTGPIRATTGPLGAAKTQDLAATEVLSVDAEDRREREVNPFGKKTGAIWLWTFLLVISISLGSYFFRDYLPLQAQQWVSYTEGQVNGLVAKVQAKIQGVPTGPAKETAAAVAGTNPTDTEKSDLNTSQQNEVGEGALTTEHALTRARGLTERLEEDLSVTPELVQLYSRVLTQNPENRNAELGLINLKQFHFSRLREELRIRDISAANVYFESLENSFENISTDETYQRLNQRRTDALDAEALIEWANGHLANDQLTSPQNANALELFDEALEVDPGNPLAEAGIAKIVQRYVELAQRALSENDFALANQFANSGLNLDSENAALRELIAQSNQQQGLEKQISDLKLDARRAIADGQFVAPAGNNAYDYFQQLRSLGRVNEANSEISDLETLISREIEQSINSNEFESAKQLLLQAKEKYSSSEKLLGLEVGLEQAIQADFESRQPKIVAIGASSEPMESIAQSLQVPLNLGRTVYVGFEYVNFSAETSVVQVVLSDASRSVEIAQKSVIVMGEADTAYFQIDSPVEGFSKGSYNIELLLNGNRLHVMEFQVDTVALVQ